MTSAAKARASVLADSQVAAAVRAAVDAAPPLREEQIAVLRDAGLAKVVARPKRLRRAS